MPILDLTGPSLSQLAAAVEFIRTHTRNGIVYVHCKTGFSRSAAIMGAYLLATGQAATVTEAIGILRAARPSIVIRPEVLSSLTAFAAHHAKIIPPHEVNK
jgi:protein-tyrosine phosphatase